MSFDSHQHNPVIQRELTLSLLGKQLGDGIGRRVFASVLDDSLVVKIEDCNGSRFQNVMEWETWKQADPKVARWLAPCLWISSCGSILMQRKTSPALKFPKRLPAFLADTKRTNYGMLNGKFVCHDYGTNLALSHGLILRERNVDWWD